MMIVSHVTPSSGSKRGSSDPRLKWDGIAKNRVQARSVFSTKHVKQPG